MNAVIVSNASAEEIAALVLAAQGRQGQESFVGVDVIRKAVCDTINFPSDIKSLAKILRLKDDTEPEAPEQPSS